MKNTRFTAGIIAFITTFALSVGLVWLFFGFPVKPTPFNYRHHNCSQRHSEAIYSFLRRDINNGEMRDVRSFSSNYSEREDRYIYSIENHANSVAEYVEASGNMNASHLPQDFQNAWRKHIDAWRDYSEYLNDLKKSKSRIKSNDFYKAEKPYNKEINETWEEVLQIGRTYGAYIE